MTVYVVAYAFSDPFKPNALGPDATAYWEAAERLRAGAPLYPAVASEAAASTFRYAPWFAYLWVPVTYLPRAAVIIGWMLIQMAAAAFLLRPLLQERTLASWFLLVLMIPLLLQQAWLGNVENLMLAAIALTMPRRSGPIWIGLAGSLKITPLAFALVYVARRQYGRAVIAVAISMALWAMALFFGVEHYPTAQTGAIPMPTVVWVALAAASIVLAAWSLRSGRYVTLASATLAIFGSPRIHLTMAPYLLVAVHRVDAVQQTPVR